MSTGIFSAVSGILANQTRLNVISNNIANVNTLGFKGSSAHFAAVFANTISGGSAPNGTLGGTNPMQVGNGVLVSGISQNFGQGGTQFTGRGTDLSINGNGFFVVQRLDGNTGNNSTDYYLTRAGNFSLDSAGNLVTASGERIRGTSQINGTGLDTLGLVQIPTGFLIAKDYDSTGKVLGTHFAPAGTDSADIAAVATIDPGTGLPAEQITSYVTLSSFSVGPDGSIAASYSNGDVITVRVNQATVDANPNDPSQWRTEIVHLPYEGGTYASSNLTTTDSGMVGQIGANSVFNGGGGAAFSGDGMEGMQMKIQMASVTNPEGLVYSGNNNYLAGANSGTTDFGSAAIGARGTIGAGSLESSNVDLAGEFTNMIIAQRGLEAASKAVKAQSEVLQTILQMT